MGAWHGKEDRKERESVKEEEGKGGKRPLGERGIEWQSRDCGGEGKGKKGQSRRENNNV